MDGLVFESSSVLPSATKKRKKTRRKEKGNELDGVAEGHDVPTGRFQPGQATEMSRNALFDLHRTRIVKPDESIGRTGSDQLGYSPDEP